MDMHTLRKHFSDSPDLRTYSQKVYGQEIEIRYSNFGFIVIPSKSDYVFKYYISFESLKKYTSMVDFEPYLKEKESYELFGQHNILIPAYQYCGQVTIGESLFHFSKIQNIRNNFIKITNFQQLDILSFVVLIKKIHSIRQGYIHGNIHPSNFFLTDKGELGVFDLINYHPGALEEDISRIYIHSDYDDYFLETFIQAYPVVINKRTTYYHTLRSLLNDTKKGEMEGHDKIIQKLYALIKYHQ